MFNNNSFLLSPSSSHNSALFWSCLLVMLMHVGLLGIGKYWNPPPPAPPKQKTKVIVQTIQLNPIQTTIVQSELPKPPSLTPLTEPLLHRNQDRDSFIHSTYKRRKGASSRNIYSARRNNH